MKSKTQKHSTGHSQVVNPKAKRVPIYATDESLPAVLNRMASHLPITDEADLKSLLCIFQNTWLNQQDLTTHG